MLLSVNFRDMYLFESMDPCRVSVKKAKPCQTGSDLEVDCSLCSL